MIGSRWGLGYQEAFEKFLASSENNNESIFNQPELEKKELFLRKEPWIKNSLVPPHLQKNKPTKASCKNIPNERKKSKVSPKEEKKPGRPKKSLKSNTDESYETTNSTNVAPKSNSEFKKDESKCVKTNKDHSGIESRKEMKNKTMNKAEPCTEIPKMKMETNDFATKCPFCNFWKLNTDIEEHLRSCPSSSSTISVPLESFYNAVEDMQKETQEKLVSPKDLKSSGKKSKPSSVQKKYDKSLSDITTENAKKAKASKAKTTEKDVDLREFYFERPKRKAHDAAMQSCKDILNEEANTKNEDYNFYKKFRKNSGDLNNKQLDGCKKESTSGIAPDSKDTNNSDGDDDVAQLANDLISNWDTKDLMKEVYDIGPSILQSMAEVESMQIEAKEHLTKTKSLSKKYNLDENTMENGFQVYRINGDDKPNEDDIQNPSKSTQHCCNECNFTTYSEVALNTHSIIYH